MSKILITGGAGFIGSHLTDRLVKLGHEVVVLDNLVTGYEENINPYVKFVKKSVNDNLEDVFEKNSFDYVFHLAAQINVRKSIENPKEDAEINIIGSLNVLKNCVKFKVKKIIFSSSAAVYSRENQLPISEKGTLNPESPYGIAKLSMENYLRFYKEVFDLEYCIFRFSNVYGPRQTPGGEVGVISIFLNQLMNKKELTIFGKGDKTRDYIYVSDVVSALVKGIEIQGVFNVSTQKETSVLDLASILKRIVGSNSNNIHVDPPKGEIQNSCLSYEKLRFYGWVPKYDLDSGLKETWDWFKKRTLK